MGVVGLYHVLDEYIEASVQTQTLRNQELIVDGHGFIEHLLTVEKPFEGTNYPPLNWINRGDRTQMAVYLYKYIKAFIDNGIHLTVVASGPCVDENKFSTAFFRIMFKSLKYSKLFYREGTAVDPSAHKVKAYPKFATILSTEIFNLLSQQYPDKVTILRTPAESAPYIIDMAKNANAVVVTNNADFILAKEDMNICRFSGITLKQREDAKGDSFEILAKVAKRTETVQYLLTKWNLKSSSELNLCLALMKNDYTDDADVRGFVGEDLFNFEKASQFIRENVDKIESSSIESIAEQIITLAYKDNEKAIQNSKSAFKAFENQEAPELIDLKSNDALAKALLPEYVQRSEKTNELASRFRSGDFPAPLIGLAHSFRNYDSIDLLSCSTDTFSSSELWYQLKATIIEAVLLAEGSALRIDPSTESKTFDNEFYGKLEKDLIEIKTSMQEKAIYLVGGNEKVLTFNRDYEKHAASVSDKQRFLKLWIPENSDKTVEDYENALKGVATVYQPLVLVFASLYHLLQTKDPKPKADFLFLNEILFASLFTEKPVENASDVAKLAETAGLSEEVTKQSEFVNSNYYRYLSYFEEGLSQYLMASSALNWFGDSFNNLATILLVNGSQSAHLRTLYNNEPTSETLLQYIPEANRQAYAQVKEAIRSLCSKEVSQHFWVEDSTDLLNTKSIFASNIPFSMKAPDFYKMFEKLKKVYLKMGDSGSHIGRGTLEFEDEEAMKKALLLNRLRIEDRYIHLTPSVATSPSIGAPKDDNWRSKDKSPTTSTGPSAEQWRAQGPTVRGGKRGRGRGGLSRGGFSTGTKTSTSQRGKPTKKEEEKKGLSVENVWDALQTMDE